MNQKTTQRMKFDELAEIYGEDLPVLLNNLTVLHNQYGDNTANLVQKVTNLHIQAANALLFPNPEMIYPEFTDNSFRSKSGVKYIIHGQLNQKRFEQLEKYLLQIDLGQSMAQPSVFIAQMRNAIDSNKPSLAGNVLYQFEQGLGYHNRMTELILLACSLFVIRENDTSDWNEANALEAIKDWQSIPYAFFLVFFNCFKQVFTEILKAGFQNTLRAQVQKPSRSKITSFFNRLKK